VKILIINYVESGSNTLIILSMLDCLIFQSFYFRQTPIIRSLRRPTEREEYDIMIAYFSHIIEWNVKLNSIETPQNPINEVPLDIMSIVFSNIPLRVYIRDC
jgi:hypothetical protein